MISAAEAHRIRSAYEAYERAREAHDPRRFKRGGGYSMAEVEGISRRAGVRKPTNEELGELELYEFMTSPPQQLFAYYDKDMRQVTTFTGQVLGRIISRGAERRPMGGRVVSVRVLGVNGVEYVGTCNLSSGTYCRLRRAARQPHAHGDVRRLDAATEFKHLLFGTRFKFVDPAREGLSGFGREDWSFVKTGHGTYRNPLSPPGKKYERRASPNTLVRPERDDDRGHGDFKPRAQWHPGQMAQTTVKIPADPYPIYPPVVVRVEEVSMLRSKVGRRSSYSERVRVAYQGKSYWVDGDTLQRS